MTTMSTVAAPAGEWTLAYTASGTITIGLHNRGTAVMLVRIGTTAATTDGADDPADALLPGETRSYPLVNTDKVIVRPSHDFAGAGKLTLRV